jgi:hypothetical protein
MSWALRSATAQEQRTAGCVQAVESTMEHWLAAVVASVVGALMVIVVLVTAFKVAGPGPAYTFSNHSRVTTVAEP